MTDNELENYSWIDNTDCGFRCVISTLFDWLCFALGNTISYS